MRVLIIAMSMAGLTGCAYCPVPREEALSQQCRTLVDNLQAQDSYLKKLVDSKAPIEPKQENARKVQENLRIYVERVPRTCPAGLATPLVAEVNQRIGQIDAYIASGVWQGPVG